MRSKVKVYNQWDANSNTDYKTWYEELYNSDWEVIIINGLWEWELYHNDTPFREWKIKYEQLIYSRGIKVYVIHGTNGPVTHSRGELTIPGSATYIYWPLFWLYATVAFSKSHITNIDKKFKITSLTEMTQKRVEADTLFISLVNKAHKHRCYAMDKLAQSGILTNGVKTNGIINYSWHDQWNMGSEYKFKYWKPNPSGLSDPYQQTLDSYQTIPNEQFTSAFNIIMESHFENQFWTEKTFSAMFFQKPFLIFGGAHINRDLNIFGFEIFDNVINYGKEDDGNYEIRVEGYMNDLRHLVNEYSENPQALYEVCRERTQHNKNLAINIVNERKFIPESIRELKDKYELTWSDLNLSFFDNYFEARPKNSLL